MKIYFLARNWVAVETVVARFTGGRGGTSTETVGSVSRTSRRAALTTDYPFSDTDKRLAGARGTDTDCRPPRVSGTDTDYRLSRGQLTNTEYLGEAGSRKNSLTRLS